MNCMRKSKNSWNLSLNPSMQPRQSGQQTALVRSKSYQSSYMPIRWHWSLHILKIIHSLTQKLLSVEIQTWNSSPYRVHLWKHAWAHMIGVNITLTLLTPLYNIHSISRPPEHTYEWHHLSEYTALRQLVSHPIECHTSGDPTTLFLFPD